MSLLIQLFLEFFKIGLFAVGGGLATIPFLHQLAEKYTWFTVETLVAVSYTHLSCRRLYRRYQRMVPSTLS